MIAKKAGLLVGVIGAAATLAAAAEGGEGGEGRHGRQFVVPYYAVGPVRVAPPPVVYVPPHRWCMPRRRPSSINRYTTRRSRRVSTSISRCDRALG